MESVNKQYWIQQNTISAAAPAPFLYIPPFLGSAPISDTCGGFLSCRTSAASKEGTGLYPIFFLSRQDFTLRKKKLVLSAEYVNWRTPMSVSAYGLKTLEFNFCLTKRHFLGFFFPTIIQCNSIEFTLQGMKLSIHQARI